MNAGYRISVRKDEILLILGQTSNVERLRGVVAPSMKWSGKASKDMGIGNRFLNGLEVTAAYLAWIFNVSEQLEIENWVICQYAELINCGFSEPVIERKDWNTVIDWLGTDIALEIELDWREFDVFLLVVRLENSQLPQGYYVSNGEPCRFHLQKVIEENGWFVALDEMKITSTNGKRGRLQKPSADNLRQRVLAHRAVLMSCINQIIANRGTIF